MPRSGVSSVTSPDTEGERLSHQHCIGLPLLSPISPQSRPFELLITLHLQAYDVTCSSHIPDGHKIEVGIPRYGEANASLPPAWYPSVFDRHNPTSVLRNAKPLGSSSLNFLRDLCFVVLEFPEYFLR
ncbi:hypothetical protein G2W53_024114 [Senna tora]|uniref:Uncharacterized protein n=1 Tax=Senna tora TaxID=362788 RepID=A0A834WIU1_9FABA|nr:hypothetical protein G2W53_024114 [Senna tora]